MLIVIALVASCFSISYYTDYVKKESQKLADVADNSYDNTHAMMLNNYSKAIDVTLSALDYLALSEEQLLGEVGETYITNFSSIQSYINNDYLLPFSAEFLTKAKLSTMQRELPTNSCAYKACSLILQDGSRPVLFFDEMMNAQGFNILYPIQNDSDYDFISAFYPPGTFIRGIMQNEHIIDGLFAVVVNSSLQAYTYNAKENEFSPWPIEDIQNNFSFTDTSVNMSSLKSILASRTEIDTILYDKIRKTDCKFYINPLSHKRCDTINLSMFMLIDLVDGYNTTTIPTINDRSITLMLLIVGIILLISIGIVLLVTYFSNFQRNTTQRLQLESARFKSIMSFTKWLIWEYSFAKKELAFISSENYDDQEPLPIEQYKNKLIHQELITSEDIPLFDKLIKNIETGSDSTTTTFRIKYDSDEYRWHEFSTHTLRDSDQKPITTQIVATDIHDRMLALEEAKNRSERDSLTGLYNFGTICDKASLILADNTSSLMHGFLLIDFDNFKALNEMYGQTFGDAILIEFASRLVSILDPSSLIGRVGSDKFIVFLYNISDPTIINEVSESILNNDVFLKYTVESDSDLHITCSIGAAIFPTHTDNFDELIRDIDIATFVAKKQGGNRLCVYDKTYDDIQTGNNFLSLIQETISENETENTLIDNDIMFNVVDILFDSKELNVSLTIALSMIGNHYHFDQVGLIEYDASNNLAVCKYSWNSPQFERFSNDIKSLDIETDNTFALFASSSDGIFYSNMVSSLPVSPSIITDIIRCSQIQSVFQCALTENGNVTGYIFALSHSVVDWKGHIADTMTLISRIIAGYLVKQRSQEDIKKLTNTDILTGSYNMSTFVTKANELLGEAPNTQYAMVYMDINKFKLVNDKYGYSTGDTVIISLAKTIASMIDKDELFARTDADRFILMIKFEGMSKLDSRLMELFTTFSTLIKNEIGHKVTLIAGVYLMHGDTNISAAIDRANIARKSIKDHHNTTYEIYNETMKDSLVIKSEIENAMEAALENEEFLVYYQPKTNIYTDTICGSEALVRWNRPGIGLVSPGVFIPIFEENGFVENVDYYVLEKVCHTLRLLIDSGKKVYPVSVNFSRIHFKNNTIVKMLESITKKYNIDPSLIEVEITESALSEGDNLAPTLLNSIKALGFKLSMDDFGCGLSSLNSLRKFPFDILKLDKEFFNKEGISEKEQIVVQNVVTLAKQLNMSIIAEGIETNEQLEFLRSIECPVVQGYVYSPPIPEDRFIEQYLS